jgi:type II secretory pathway pseudopilin PulG
MVLHTHSRPAQRRKERGYILLSLLLVIALMVIAAGIIIPSITFDIKRDREEEMIHRGVQYSRAIRAYYKKFGRYPAKLEDLESANNLRFLRKRYKDPVTGKDFQLLHFGDVKLTFTGGIGGAMVPGANTLGGPGGLSGNAALQNLAANAIASYAGGQQNVNPAVATSDSSQQPGQSDAGPNGAGPNGTSNSTSGSSSPFGSGNQAGGTGTFGGGPIVGVASTSKKETIREFNHKKKYNDWQFIYDPGTDRGGLITTPNQPGLQNFGSNIPGAQSVGPNGQIGPANGVSNGFGNSFGNQQPQGIQNNPAQPPPGGITAPNPPETTPPQ